VLNVDVIMGVVPNIVGLMWSGQNYNKILQQFGVVYKDQYYQAKYNKAESILSSTAGGLRSCSTLASFNSNKSQEIVTMVASGQIISSRRTYSNNLSAGVKYSSKGYDIDYYNVTLVPT
jgi:tryptophan synthase beta subunit